MTGRKPRRTAKKPAKPKTAAKATTREAAAPARRRRSLLGRLVRHVLSYVFGAITIFIALVLAWIVLLKFVDPPFGGPYMVSEFGRLGEIRYEPLPLDRLGLRAAQSAVAAEDARFCTHRGVDWAAIKDAMDDYMEKGRLRGGSTITQQTAKNVFLWHGRSMTRKALELPMAGLIELIWGKRRIVEVYLNIAEFDEGVFGLEAGAKHYYNAPAAALTDNQMARMMTLLPAPKSRNPTKLSGTLRRRAGQIQAGVGTIEAQGLDQCFR